MAAAAQASSLIEELIEEILLRLPPAEPASLVHAALVCKPWCRLISGPRFRRRFREFHRTAPMLGFISNRNESNSNTDSGSDSVARFVPTSSFRPRQADHRGWRALDACHGRVLFRSSIRAPRGPLRLAIWNPVTDEWRQLPRPPVPIPMPMPDLYYCNAAVLCAAAPAAAASGAGACNHLDCHHHGPFLVVVLDNDLKQMTLRVYSSQAGTWSTTYVAQSLQYGIRMAPPAIVGNVLHFDIDVGASILSYDLATRQTSVILQPPGTFGNFTVIMAMEDGGLGVAVAVPEVARLSLWSLQAAEWVQTRVIELDKLLSVDACSICCNVFGFAHGVRVFFIGTDDGLLSFDLKSGRVRKVLQEAYNIDDDFNGIIPYMSFYTPALGAVSTGSDKSA